MLTGLLGNLSLLSYFAKKRETEAILVQTLGVISTYVVVAQLAMAEAMLLPYFTVTSVVVGAGLVLNFLNYFNMLNSGIWSLWEDFTTVGGLSVLPQAMWSTFVPYVPNSILPGAISFVIALTAVFMVRDYRNCNLVQRAGSISLERSPIVHKVILKLCIENVLKDILLTSDSSWTYRDVLDAESRILRALQPNLNLNPKPLLNQFSGERKIRKVEAAVLYPGMRPTVK